MAKIIKIKILLLSQLCLAFSILIFALPVWAGSVYYVKSGGNDSADGLSDANAWATISKVEATVSNGDTVYFRSQDTWSGQATLLTCATGVTYDGSTYGSGTRAKLQATSTSSISQAVIRVPASNITIKGFEVDGGDEKIAGIQIGGRAAQVDIDSITIDDCIVYNIGNDTGSVSYSSGIDLSPRNDGGGDPHHNSNITIKNTTVHDTVRNAIAVYPAWTSYDGNYNDTVTIQNCTIYNAGNNGGMGVAGSGIGVHIKSDSRNVTVENCYMYDNTSAAIYVESFYEDPDVAPTNMVIRNNLMKDNTFGFNIVMNHSNASVTGSIYSNIIMDSTMNDIASGGGDYHSTALNFYNNTIYTTVFRANGAVNIDGGSTPMTGTPTFNFKNNAIYTTQRPCYTECWNDDDDDHTLQTTHTNNLYYRSSGSNDAHVIAYKYGTRETTYDRSGVTTWEATAQNTNPNFTGGSLPTGFTGNYGIDMVPNTNYFFITKGNALNNGANLGSPYNSCINGAGLETPITRSQSGAWDIGAYEYPGPQPPTGLRIQN